MKINDFKLEVYFGKHEFSAPYLLSQSDCESMSIQTLLNYEEGALETFLASGLGYTEVPGSPALRAQIASLYETLTAEDIVVHAGAQEPIFNLMNVLLDEKDHVICQFPIYQSLYEVANAIGCEVSKWEAHPSSAGWMMVLTELEALIQPHTKLIILNSPNNPTGYTFSQNELEQIAALAKKHNLYVLCDEVYKGVELDGIIRPWFADCYEKGISLGVMSKAYGLAGLRIGWLATKDQELVEQLMKMKHYTSICSSGPSEVLAVVALKHGSEILSQNKALIQENIEAADVFFSKHPHVFEFIKPVAGPVGFLKMQTEKPIDQFCDEMVYESGILLLPATVFDVDGPYVRLGFGRKDFKANLLRFEAYLASKNII